MSFSVYLFAADPHKVREKLVGDPALVPEVSARAARHGMDREEIQALCARVDEARSLRWPAGVDMLSVSAFMWMLDYAAEPVNISRLQDVRYSSDVDEVPLLAEMTAKRGPLPLPDVRGLECEIGYLPPEELREFADRGPTPCANPHLDVGTELIEVFESLADDNLGLYTIIDGATTTRGHRSQLADPMPSMAQLRDAVRTVIGDLLDDDNDDEDSGVAAPTITRQLFDAAQEGDAEKVRALLRGGADVNAKRPDRYTPFLLALGEGHNDVCRLLLDAGARPDTTIEDGSSAMHVAAAGGNVEGLELLHRPDVPIDARDRLGCTALFEAATLETAEWLLQHGADVNARDKYGMTPLHQAYAMSDDYEEEHGVPSPWTGLLEKHGADPTLKDDQGRTPRDFPIR